MHRYVHATVPPQVDYSITDAGRGAYATVSGLCEWSRRHLAQVLEARTRG